MIEVIIGLGILSALFIYMAFTLAENHAVLKYLSFYFALLVMIALSSQINTEGEQHCDFKLINQTVSSGNFTAYQYDYICEQEAKTASGLAGFKLVQRFHTLIGWYALLYVIVLLLKFVGIDLIQVVWTWLGRK